MDDSGPGVKATSAGSRQQAGVAFHGGAGKDSNERMESIRIRGARTHNLKNLNLDLHATS